MPVPIFCLEKRAKQLKYTELSVKEARLSPRLVLGSIHE